MAEDSVSAGDIPHTVAALKWAGTTLVLVAVVVVAVAAADVALAVDVVSTPVEVFHWLFSRSPVVAFFAVPVAAVRAVFSGVPVPFADPAEFFAVGVVHRVQICGVLRLSAAEYLETFEAFETAEDFETVGDFVIVA